MLWTGGILATSRELHPGERFIVSTPKTPSVEVHGTVFRVAVVQPSSECREHTQTRVFVSEGVVAVRVGGRSSYVHPGEHWPADSHFNHAFADKNASLRVLAALSSRLHHRDAKHSAVHLDVCVWGAHDEAFTGVKLRHSCQDPALRQHEVLGGPASAKAKLTSC